MGRKISIICIIICTLFMGELHAQMKSVGTTYSYAGIGFIYEHDIDSGSFIDVQLRMETVSLLKDRRNLPGVSGSFTWNMILAEKIMSDGNKLDIFAGPGLIVGYTDDIRSGKGFMFGLKGRVGGECTFKRRISVSISIAPVLGMHLGRHDGMLNMLFYKTGILYGIMPEVGLKYAF